MSRFSTSRERSTFAKGTSTRASHPVGLSVRRAERFEGFVCAGLCATVVLLLGGLVVAASLEARDVVAALTSWIKWAGLTALVGLAVLVICGRPDA